VPEHPLYGLHVGSVRTRSPTKLFGNSSRGSATATFYPRLPTKSPPCVGI
jgi:hypothetical protein